MARSKRRRLARSGRRLAFWLTAIAAVAVVVTIWGCVALNRHIQGYFGASERAKTQTRAEPSATASGAGAGAEATAAPQGSASSPTPVGSAAPQVAIIIDDCGYSEDRCKAFLELPIPITLSILPMSPHGKQIVQDTVEAGKSVMLHLPMEPDSPQANPGPGAITTEMSDEQVHAQVEADLDSLPDVPGANNHMGSKATSDPRVMRDVLAVLQERHMFFIDSLTSGSTVGESTARELGIPTAERDVFLDNQKNVPYIVGQIKQLEDVARKRGSAIGIGHPNPETLQALTQTVPAMQSAGIVFVTAESLVR